MPVSPPITAWSAGPPLGAFARSSRILGCLGKAAYSAVDRPGWLRRAGMENGPMPKRARSCWGGTRRRCGAQGHPPRGFRRSKVCVGRTARSRPSVRSKAGPLRRRGGHGGHGPHLVFGSNAPRPGCVRRARLGARRPLVQPGPTGAAGPVPGRPRADGRSRRGHRLAGRCPGARGVGALRARPGPQQRTPAPAVAARELPQGEGRAPRSPAVATAALWMANRTGRLMAAQAYANAASAVVCTSPWHGCLCGEAAAFGRSPWRRGAGHGRRPVGGLGAGAAAR